MREPTSSDDRDLLGLVAHTEFLVRTGQHAAAVAAADRLSDALLAHYRHLAASSPASPEAERLRRDALRLWADAELLGRRLRLGPVRRPPKLRHRVEVLLLSEVVAALDDDRGDRVAS
jgi:hypothetical protein